MKKHLPAALLLLTGLLATPLLATAQSTDDITGQLADEDDQGEARVARLSFVQGDVSFLREGDTEWAEAVLNLPLLAGDQVYCGSGSRAEIQLGRGTYVRLSERTALAIVVLSESTAQLEITEGTATIRIDHFAAAFDRFEVDTPSAALILQRNGQYRIDVASNGQSELIVRRGAAEVSTLDGSFKLREGYRMVVGPDAGHLEIALDTSRDDWDRWTVDRDTTIDRVTIAASPDYVTSYETNYNSFYGASDLSSYGSWTSVSSYGYCWLPRVSSDWAPYRLGEWIWIPRVGWTWISYEPWGWAPYHYGRWVHIGGLGWAWAPGFHHYGRSYFYWRPALVHFFNCPTPRGHYIGWYPLSHGERWRRPERYSGGGSHPGLRYPSVRDGWRRPDGSRPTIAQRRPGVTMAPVAGFTRPAGGSGALGRSRPQAPDRELRPWLDRNERPGLPPVSRPTTATAPGGRWAAVRPSSEIITRPVVTRNLAPARPSGEGTSTVGGLAPRARRLVEARPIPSDNRGSRRLDIDGGERPARENRGWTQAPDQTITRPAERVRPTPDREVTSADERPSSSERRGNERVERPVFVFPPARGRGDAGADGSDRARGRRASDSEGDSQPRVEPRVRERQADPPGRRPRDDSGDSEDRPRQPRDRPRSNDDGNRWTAVPDTQTRTDPGSSPRARERSEAHRESPRSDPPRSEPRAEPRHEPRRERPESPREERRQEREERREERNADRPRRP